MYRKCAQSTRSDVQGALAHEGGDVERVIMKRVRSKVAVRCAACDACHLRSVRCSHFVHPSFHVTFK